MEISTSLTAPRVPVALKFHTASTDTGSNGPWGRVPHGFHTTVRRIVENSVQVVEAKISKAPALSRRGCSLLRRTILRSHACRLRRVFSHAHVLGKYEISIYSVTCGRRNSARLFTQKAFSSDFPWQSISWVATGFFLLPLYNSPRLGYNTFIR